MLFRELSDGLYEFVLYGSGVLYQRQVRQQAVLRVEFETAADAIISRFRNEKFHASVVVHRWAHVPRIDASCAPGRSVVGVNVYDGP